MTPVRKKLQTVTLGCSKNKVDTEHILSQVEDLYEVVPEGEDIPVDIILLNTCGFIGDAKEESVQAVLEAVERKRRGEAGKVIVFGCLSQRYASELPDLIPEVDEWYGARDFDKSSVEISLFETQSYEWGKTYSSFTFVSLIYGIVLLMRVLPIPRFLKHLCTEKELICAFGVITSTRI